MECARKYALTTETVFREKFVLRALAKAAAELREIAVKMKFAFQRNVFALKATTRVEVDA